jgi:RHS repeat-associated protein
MESLPATPGAAKKRLEFKYDYQGRRVEKKVLTWNGSQYVAQSTNRFIYDGWNLIAILDAQSSILQSFTWGLDISGTRQGAGGIGGLLSMTVTNGASYFYSYDGNGNVTTVLNAADGATSAQYEYGPFLELLRATGPLARLNRFRASTKLQDDDSDLLYYGHRYLSTASGRWLSKDPVDERGGPNLYAFVGNNPLSRADVLGLWDPAGHWDIGLSAMRNAGFRLTPEEMECFRRGLILPDLPFLDVKNLASRLDQVPLAWYFHLKAKIGEFLDPFQQAIEDAEDYLWIFDLDDPFTVIGVISRPVADRAEYWWQDSSFAGPILTHIPYINDTHTVRTHWGDLGYEHAMGTTGMAAGAVQRNVVNYVNGKLKSFRDKLCSDPCRAYIDLGMALHTLQDSWAGGHVVRDANGLIQWFQDYNGQSLHYHEHNDHISSDTQGNFNSAVSTSVLMILQAESDDAIDSSPFFRLAPGARVGHPPGTGSIGFWDSLFTPPRKW